MTTDELRPGLYETLLTSRLASLVRELQQRGLQVETDTLDPVDSYEVFARHLYEVIRQTLRSLPQDKRIEQQLGICNRLLRELERAATDLYPPGADIKAPPEALAEVTTGERAPDGAHLRIVRPHVPLSVSDLLVNARGEPAVGHAIEREIPSADGIDLLCAFVRWNGLRLVERPLREHLERGRPLRVITTTYTGSTERRALDLLVSLGAQVKVSYETHSTRLHAKAWLFHRASGYSTAYIGSSNLTRWALLDGLEWNVRLAQVTSPEILEKFGATFNSYWEESDFESYDPQRDADRLDRALHATPSTNLLQIATIDVNPYPHQSEILERLAAERERHGRYRSLVVAATGTGKTIVAALDYRRLREQLNKPSLLFVAHRKELLNQSLVAFRTVLRDGSFGELYVDGRRPDEWRHVFASVQSLAQLDLAALRPEAFDVVIVDEFHHAAAETYRRLLAHLRPRVLLGLTATPERADGHSILEWFDGRIAVELRLWEALERGLLCPFHYFGVHDNTDLSHVSWSRRGYDVGELENLYTGNHARAGLVAQTVREKISDLREMRALGFCVSIAHAEFMARDFSDRLGIPSAAVSSASTREQRDDAVRGLRDHEINVLFAVDLFNEGIDVPEIDTVLFLRPTESATVFLQQLGRGLRHSEGKSCLTVLDFIGNAHRRFRFDLKFRALTNATRAGVIRQVEEAFPYLPPGCKIQLDRVATDLVLDNLRTAVGGNRNSLVQELQRIGPAATFQQFLTEGALDLTDVYRNPGWTWTELRRLAGFSTEPAGPQEARLARGLQRVLHTDDQQRLALLRSVLNCQRPPEPETLTDTERRILVGLHFTLWGTDGDWSDLRESMAALWEHPAVVAELRDLLSILEERSERLTYPLDAEVGWQHKVPLAVHASYSLDEVLAAFGKMTLEDPHRIREGTYFHEPTQSDLFFVTLEKSEEHYSPTTMYKDYAISPTLFHWESQSTTTRISLTGQRYINQRQRGTNAFLFVRRRARMGTRTAPYVFLGAADHVSHEGERPIAFVWQLRRAMPADFFREAKVAAG